LTTNAPNNRFATDIEGDRPEQRVSFCDILCDVTILERNDEKLLCFDLWENSSFLRAFTFCSETSEKLRAQNLQSIPRPIKGDLSFHRYVALCCCIGSSGNCTLPHLRWVTRSENSWRGHDHAIAMNSRRSNPTYGWKFAIPQIGECSSKEQQISPLCAIVSLHHNKDHKTTRVVGL
jgi:hypothetical protein